VKIAITAGFVPKTIGPIIAVWLSLFHSTTLRASESYAVVADHGRTEYEIILGASASEVEKFASEELQKYLDQITGATLPVSKTRGKGNAILIGKELASSRDLNEATLGYDGFIIDVQSGKIVLAGVNDRATLYSVYTFLEKMGCRWFAPNFDFYGAVGEFVPSLPLLKIPTGTTRAKSSMKYRKEDIGEGRTHTVSNMRQIIDWMPKVRMNVFQAPLDYGGQGTVVWDNWRSDLIPDLKKRGLLVEIGGHGYQDYLPQSKYFPVHPEWFGMVDGKRSAEERLVFESTNLSALAEFLHNIKTYLHGHPEIDIFDLWPPDGARWSQSPESNALGAPTQRHALIVNEVARMVKREFPRVIVEFLAYENYVTPPTGIVFEDNTTLDFCPIARSFQVPLWDTGNEFNRPYSEALAQWLKRDVFKGDISIYTYYRKYAWRSLPIVIPRLIAQEAKHYQAMGINGMGLYSEPGNWFTYELSNYIFSRITFDSNLNVDDELSDYSQKRFGPAAGPLSQYLETIGTVGPAVLRIPGTVVPDQREVEKGLDEFGHASDLLQQADKLSAGDTRVQLLVTKFHRELDYAMNDVQIRLVAWSLFKGPTFSDEAPQMSLLLKRRRELLEANPNQGLFVIAGPHVVF
jgi:hypothetical protein